MPKKRYDISLHPKVHGSAMKLLPYTDDQTGETAETFSALVSLALKLLPRKKR